MKRERAEEITKIGEEVKILWERGQADRTRREKEVELNKKYRLKSRPRQCSECSDAAN